MKEAEVDLYRKVKELLDIAHKRDLILLKKLLKVNPEIVQTHIDAGGSYSTPKDIFIAFMEEDAWGHMPLGCHQATVRRSKKNVRNFRKKIWNARLP